MAYRSTSRSRSGSARRAKSPARSYRSRAGSGRSRPATTRRASRARAPSPRTIRIVIEQPAANAVQRPPLGTAVAPTPRKAAF